VLVVAAGNRPEAHIALGKKLANHENACDPACDPV